MTKITLCCFGITRSLRHTINSIDKYVKAPAQAVGETMTYCHFFEQNEAISVHGRPEGRVDVTEAALLKPDWIETEAPGGCLDVRNFDAIAGFGDHWNNAGISLRNLVHQLHSLDVVTTAALATAPDIVIFCRPDLKYHDNLAPVLDQAQKIAPDHPTVFLPQWQPWGGYNDRFAIAVGHKAIDAYGTRITQALAFCTKNNSPLHSERLLKYCLTKADVAVVRIPTRASRVRASGAKVWESFGDADHAVRHEQRKTKMWQLLDRTGLKPVARVMARLLSPKN